MKTGLHRWVVGAAFLGVWTGCWRYVPYLGAPSRDLAMAADAKLGGDLARAIRAGDLDAVKAAVDAGADINAVDERKMPPIGAAALLGRVDIVNYLADRGANVNRNDGFGYTPLMCAAQHGQAGAVRSLLKHGADPELKGGNGSDALFYAQPKGPADPLYDEKTAVIKILKDAVAAKAHGGNAAAPLPAAPAPAAPVPPAAVPGGRPPPVNAPPVAGRSTEQNVPNVPLDQSALVVRNADGTLGVGQKDGKPIDGLKLSVHDNNEASPSIAVAPDGSIHVAFNETHGPPYQTAVYHRSSNDGGRTWTEAKNLSEDMVDLNIGRCLVIADAQGRVYVIWRAGLGKYFAAPVDPYTGGHCNLVYRVLAAGKWSKVIPVHPPGSTKDQNDGSLAFYASLDNAGRVNVVWNTNPNKWHDELVEMVKLSDRVWRRGFNNVGNGLVFQSTLDGATPTPPREAMLTPVTGSKTGPDHPPACNGLDTLNGFIDASGQPLFIAHVTSNIDEALRSKYRYQVFEGGKPGAFLDLPDLSFHAWRDIPTLLMDARGKRHVIVLYPAGEHPNVRDYLIGSDEEPTIIRQTAGTKATLDGMQAFQGPAAAWLP